MAAEPTNTNVIDNPQNINPNPQADPKNDQTDPAKEDVTVESLMEEAARARAAEQKMKMALDKALKEKGDLTKQYREVLTESQQAKIDKENADEEHRQYVAELEAFKRKTEAKNRYLMQGMGAEMAEKAAEAEVSGDMDALADIQKQHTETVLKSARAEWQKTIPQPQFGVGGEGNMSKEEIMAIKDPAERRMAIAKNISKFR